MPTEIRMPALFSSKDEGTLARWLVKEGQQVKPGDAIAEVETDEATMEIEAIDAGRIAKFLIPEGTTGVKVNAPIALLDQGAGGAQRDAPAAPRTAAAAPTARVGSVTSAKVRDGLGGSQPAQAPAMSRTRLMGGHGQSPGDGGAKSVSPVMQAGPAKTEFIRAEEVQTDPVAGWVVVVKGPGRGGFRPVFVGMNSVGRDPGQRVCLSFGDDSISREAHAYITYDEEQRRFYIQHGGKSNLVRLGKQPVLVPTELKPNDLIRLGKTTLRFVRCCGPDFSWADGAKEG
jgi:hypothetical protein